MTQREQAEKKRSKTPFRSIRSKFLLFGLCVALIPITVDATLHYFNARRLLKRQIQEEMAAVAEAKKTHILEFMEAKKGRTVDFSSDGFIRDSLEKINLGESSEQVNVTALNKYLTLNKKPLDPGILAIAVVDPNGRVVASTNEKIIGRDVSGHEQFKQAIGKSFNQPYVGEIRRSPILEKNSIFVSVPVTSGGGVDTIGVLINAYDLATLSEIMASGIELGETGEAYLVNSDGLMLTKSRFIEGAPLTQVVDTEPVRKMAKNGGHMTGIYLDYRGVPVVGASVCIPEYNWTLLAEIDKSEAFAPLKTLGIIALAIWLITAAATASVGIVFASSQSQPIKKLTDAARKLAAGNLEYRVKIDRRDEVGELARSFNTMADELSKESYKLALAVEQSPSIVTITDTDGNIEYVNPRFTQITGYTPEEVIGKNPCILKSGKTSPEVYKRLWETITSGGEWRGEFCNKKKNGELYWESAVISSIKNAEGVITHFIGSAEDTTERRQVKEKLNQLAYYDPLTGLPNRTLLNDRLTVAIAHTHRSKEGLAVLLLDLDRFKYVNDTLGHSVGDHLLKAVAKTPKTCVREGDTVSRLGGDEFVVLLPGIIHKEDPPRVAEKILEAVRKPLDLGGHALHITVSIGITLYPNDGKDVETLLKNADTAMYHAKAHGRNIYQYYTSAMYTRIADRLTLEDDLHKAVEREEFVLYYQPQVDVKTGRITSVESLIRWQHPKRGLLSPMEFIHVAEDTGLITPISEWVLRTAGAQGKSWQDVGLPPLRIAVNLSAHAFLQPHLTETISEALRKTSFAPRLLELEITENTIMQNTQVTTHRLRELNSMGISIAIDDFGTGYSSLGYLKSFPIQKLKIDRTFVRDITTDPNDAAIVTAIIAIARTLKLKVVAEGVETEEQLAFLRSVGCDEIQGYLFSKPMPAEEFEKALGQSKGIWLGKVKKTGDAEKGREADK